MNSFNSISNRNELADFLKISRKWLTYILYQKKIENCYTSFIIPKKAGGERIINAPTDDLKGIQVRLANALWQYQKKLWKDNNITPNISHAFTKGKSIFTNAKIHRNKRYVLNLDLSDFFTCFHFGRVRGFFAQNKNFQLIDEVAVIIAQLTCYKGYLPQGAPTSPIITNLICNILDIRLLKIAKKYLLDYTRYADDLTFSTNNKDFLEKHDNFLEEINKEIQNAGFSINEKKTRLQFRDSRQEVTGIIVNEKLNIDRRYYKLTKAMAHNLYSTGKFYINDEEGTLNQLEGRFSFIDQIDKYNNKLDGNKHDSWHLNGKEEQYKKFLFYKYFYNNDKPVIVTEGKTDIVYLKAALKNLYKDYPNLVEKSSKGEFTFKISFFKRSERMNYFFGMGQDGADSMKNLYNSFSLKNSKQSECYSYFNKKCGSPPSNPVILIFDNEINNKKKPLYHFTSYVGLSKHKTQELRDDLFVKLIDNTNLFLATNPLVKGKEECEIEDLFNDSTLSINLDGKRFCRSDNYDTKEFFGKYIFSRYVSQNYKIIDFTDFKIMLNIINEIVESYHKSLGKYSSVKKVLSTE